MKTEKGNVIINSFTGWDFFRPNPFACLFVLSAAMHQLRCPKTKSVANGRCCCADTYTLSRKKAHDFNTLENAWSCNKSCLPYSAGSCGPISCGGQWRSSYIEGTSEEFCLVFFFLLYYFPRLLLPFFHFFLLSFCCLFLKHHNFSHTSPVCCRTLSASDKAKVLTVYFIHFPPTHPPTNRFAACSLVLFFFVLPQEFWSVRLVVVCVCCLCVCVCACARCLFHMHSSALLVCPFLTSARGVCVSVCVFVCKKGHAIFEQTDTQKPWEALWVGGRKMSWVNIWTIFMTESTGHFSRPPYQTKKKKRKVCSNRFRAVCKCQNTKKIKQTPWWSLWFYSVDFGCSSMFFPGFFLFYFIFFLWRKGKKVLCETSRRCAFIREFARKHRNVPRAHFCWFALLQPNSPTISRSCGISTRKGEGGLDGAIYGSGIVWSGVPGSRINSVQCCFPPTLLHRQPRGDSRNGGNYTKKGFFW